MSIGVGVLGFAHGHVSAYCQKWNENKQWGVDVKAGWDHDIQRLDRAVKEYGLEGYCDTRKLLSRSDIEAVVIGAETSMHADLVEEAAAAGKKIVLQKPMALTLSQADRIVDAVNRYKVPFTMAWQMRVDPQNVKMKELLKSGKLGKIFMVRRRHGLGIHMWEGFADQWHVKPEYNRDIWADDASHAIDFIHWLLGVPESVTADITSIADSRIPNDNGIAIFRYPEGHLAETFCSFTCVAAENTTEIIAEKGSIIQNYGDVPSCNVPRPEDSPGLKWYLSEEGKWTISDIDSPPNHGYRIQGLAEPLAEFLHGKRAPIATVEEGRTSLRMLLATYLSAREGRRVYLNEEGIANI